MTGKVYLAGAGPGGLSLLTFRAREVIEKADVILYDQLPGEEIIASLPAAAEKIDVGKRGGCHTMPQEEIESLMVRLAREGKKCCPAQRRRSFCVWKRGRGDGNSSCRRDSR